MFLQFLEAVLGRTRSTRYHTRVLVYPVQHPEETLREVTMQVEITERAAKQIVRDLGEADILLRGSSGRRNGYTVAGTCPLRRPLEARRSGQNLLAARGG